MCKTVAANGTQHPMHVSMDNPQLETVLILGERLEKLRRNKYNNIISVESCFIPSEVNEATDWISRNPE